MITKQKVSVELWIERVIDIISPPPSRNSLNQHELLQISKSPFAKNQQIKSKKLTLGHIIVLCVIKNIKTKKVVKHQ